MKCTPLIRIALVAALAICCPRLFAEIPGMISYQGRLTDNLGQPLTGSHSLTFQIFADSNGTAQIWTETQNNITVTEGLFSVILGAVVPIPLNAFTGPVCYLGVGVDGGAPLRPLRPMVSTPYAFRADIAGRAYIGGGWYDYGTNVALETPSDKVGIGTTTPTFKLDVVGSARASDSLLGSKLRLGSPTDDGRLNLYGNQTSGPALTLREFSSGGGAIDLFHGNGSTANYLAADGDGSGGYLTVRRSTVDFGLIVDGNYSGSNNPRISILGADRSALFDMNASEDSSVMLPGSAISSLECANEAGLANTRRTTVVELDDTLFTVASRLVRFPTDGYALVLASGSLEFRATSSDTFRLGVSNTETTFPVSANILMQNDLLAGQKYIFPMVAQGYFSVDAGVQYFYLLAKRPLHSANTTFIHNANLAVLFFPTSYAWFLPPAAGTAAGSDPEQVELDRQTQTRLDAQIAKLRAEFEAKLEQIRIEAAKQQPEVDSR